MWILTHAFFAETFQPMNAALTFQIGLNDSARAIRGKFTFAGAWEGFWGIGKSVILFKKRLESLSILVKGSNEYSIAFKGVMVSLWFSSL